MTDTETNSADNAVKDIGAVITDADIERAKLQVGIPQKTFCPAFHPIAFHSAMSNFAFGRVGDDNPLWHDPDYATKTRWRDLIAHPLFITVMGVNETTSYSDELKKLFRGLFRGVGKYHSGQRLEFYRPIYQGTKLFREYTTTAVETRSSKFSGGRSVIETFRSLYVDNSGTPYAVCYDDMVSAERGGTAKTGQYKSISRQTYTDEDIAEIDRRYEAEELRGATARYWEDVAVGDALVPVVKGPLSMVDMISSHVATGMALMWHHGPLRYAYKTRKRMPAFYTKDKYGVPQAQQRVHWDQERANDLGLPAPFDYGALRTAWLSHLVTNWMGDDAWLWKLSIEIRKFNFMGDTHVCGGEVVAVRREGVHLIAEIEVRATNQRGEVTTTGLATVILPSREHGPIQLPEPPQDLSSRGAQMMHAAAERLRERGS